MAAFRQRPSIKDTVFYRYDNLHHAKPDQL